MTLPSKESVAQQLAQSHREADGTITKIFRLVAPGRENDPNEPIKLLEVTPNSTASGIMPVMLPAHAPSGIAYPSIVVEIHPTELPQLLDGKLRLPPGWELDEAKTL